MTKGSEKVVKRDIVAIGASAGGLRALMAILPEFPSDLAASVFIVQHLDPRYPSQMTEILRRHTEMPVKEAEDGEAITKPMIYVALPDRHMLVDQNHIHLTKTELVHFVRPSVDLLFESVAATYGERAIGVILTGSGRDGALGIGAIKERGGLTIVQDPKTADTTGMPNAAVATGAADFVLPLEEIADKILQLIVLEE